MHNYGYGGYGMSNAGLGFDIFSLIIHIALIVLIVWFIIWLIRSLSGGRGHQRWQMWQSHSALSILNERFAKGEIEVKEYEERKKALMGEMK